MAKNLWIKAQRSPHKIDWHWVGYKQVLYWGLVTFWEHQRAWRWRKRGYVSWVRWERIWWLFTDDETDVEGLKVKKTTTELIKLDDYPTYRVYWVQWIKYKYHITDWVFIGEESKKN